jgi:hypothetical protein
MSRWTEHDLAQKIADNPALRISGVSKPLEGKVRATLASPPENKPDMPSVKRKYRNIPVKVDGIRFDSKKEAARWVELKALRQNLEIRDLERQVKFELGINGTKVCDYVCDFHYYEKPPQEGADWLLVVEDVKSVATRKLPVFRIKKRLMLAIYGITIRET